MCTYGYGTYGPHVYTNNIRPRDNGTHHALFCDYHNTIYLTNTQELHNYVGATCVARGVCDTCNKVGDFDADNHSLSAWVQTTAEEHYKYCTRDRSICTYATTLEDCSSTTPATCQGKAVCDTCSYEFGLLPNHSFNDYLYENVRTGYHRQICDFRADPSSTCDKHKDELIPCSVGDEGVPASCATLPICGYCFEEFGVINPAAHDYDNELSQIPGKDKHGYECLNGCGEYDEEADCYSNDVATCILYKICGGCRKEYGDLDPDNHQNLFVIPYIEPTCTEDGWTEGEECLDCGKVTIPQEIIEAPKHLEMDANPVDPTCLEPGLTAGKYCCICGAITSPQGNIPALGHNLVQQTINGVTVTKCTRCSFTEGGYRQPGKEEEVIVTPVMVRTAEGENAKYSTAITEAEIEAGTKVKVLEIVAEPDDAGNYVNRNLHLTPEYIQALAEQEVVAIRFIVGDAVLFIPLDFFTQGNMPMLLATYSAQHENAELIFTVTVGAEPAFTVLLSDGKDTQDVTQMAAGVKFEE